MCGRELGIWGGWRGLVRGSGCVAGSREFRTLPRLGGTDRVFIDGRGVVRPDRIGPFDLRAD